MAIAFVDQPPTLEQRHGNFVMTFDSGGEQIQLMLTRHATLLLGRAATNGAGGAFAADAKIMPFRAKRRAGK